MRHGLEQHRIDAESIGRRTKPCGRAFDAQRERRGQSLGATVFQGARRIGKERLRQEEFGIWPHGRKCGGVTRRQELHLTDAKRFEHADELILDHIGQRSHDEQPVLARSARGDRRNERGETCILALRECCLDSTA